jgi:hypothetical protein
MSKMIIIDTFQKSIILEVLRKHKLRAVIDKINWDSNFLLGRGGGDSKQRVLRVQFDGI